MIEDVNKLIEDGIAACDADEWQKALEFFEQAVLIDPNSAKAWGLLGIARRRNGDLEGAITAGRTSVDLEETWQSQSALGESYWRSGRVDDAIEAFRRSIVWGADAHVYISLADGLRARDRECEAEEIARRGLEISPMNSRVLCCLARCIQAHNPPEAETLFRRAIEFSPNDDMGYRDLGILLFGQQRLPEAVTNLRRAKELDPTDVLTRASLGSVLYKLGMTGESEKEYLDAVLVAPKSALAHRMLGHFYRDTDRTQLAESEYRKAAEFDPTDLDSLYALAWFLGKQGRRSEAIDWLNRILTTDEKYESARSLKIYLIDDLEEED